MTMWALRQQRMLLQRLLTGNGKVLWAQHSRDCMPMIAKLHMHKYGTTQEQLAAVAVKTTTRHNESKRSSRMEFQLKL